MPAVVEDQFKASGTTTCSTNAAAKASRSSIESRTMAGVWFPCTMTGVPESAGIGAKLGGTVYRKVYDYTGMVTYVLGELYWHR